MLSFKSYLTEGVSPANIGKASFIIQKYLKKKTKLNLFQYPGIEQFKNSKGKGFGVRFFTSKKNISIRFNWRASASVGLANLESITYWNGKEEKPYVITFDKTVSLVKTLPAVADIMISGKVPSKIYTMPDDVSLNESYEDTLFEAVAFDIPEIYDGVLDLLQKPNFSKGKIYSAFKGNGQKIFNELENRFPDLIVKSGTKYSFEGTPKDVKQLEKEKDSVLDAIGVVTGNVSRGSKETYEPTDGVIEMENNMERLSFEEQLKDLENLTKLTIAGASNALFIAGKGGVGKTHTTEKILNQMGLTDGKEYFKNTGSASAAGIYSLLFRYKNDVILFDDSDDAFKDQSARNIFKAATDTKKIRKLVWNKLGANVADPDEMTDDEILNAGLIPRYFEFTGKIIVISNLALDKLDPDGALRTRGYIINIDPTEMEIYDFMEKIVDGMQLEEGLSLDTKGRKKVVDLLRKGNSKQSPNLRKLSRGLNMAAGAIRAGVSVADADLSRMIETYS